MTRGISVWNQEGWLSEKTTLQLAGRNQRLRGEVRHQSVELGMPPRRCSAARKAICTLDVTGKAIRLGHHDSRRTVCLSEELTDFCTFGLLGVGSALNRSCERSSELVTRFE